ncbi:MAG: hypothetical protein Pg6C_16390 [Treponemataceae bacterium]|nr:MAG: hypothetical protein Pg6C_16390 [Treponemataceae bacterium]
MASGIGIQQYIPFPHLPKCLEYNLWFPNPISKSSMFFYENILKMFIEITIQIIFIIYTYFIKEIHLFGLCLKPLIWIIHTFVRECTYIFFQNA